MLALNLPASLSPQVSDGSTQPSGLSTDEPAMIALFEQALGLGMEPLAQQPNRPAIHLAAMDHTALSSELPVPKADIKAVLVQQPAVIPGTVATANAEPKAFSPSRAPTISVPISAAPIELDKALPSTAVTAMPVKKLVPGLDQTSAPTLDSRSVPTTAIDGDTPLRTQTVSAEGLRLPTDLPVMATEPLSQGFSKDAAATPRLTAVLPIDTATQQSPVLTTEFMAAPVTVSEGTTAATAEPVRTVIASNTTLEPQAMAQVRDTIRAGTRTGTIEVQLDPPELGRVVIELEVGRQGQVKAVISASEADTLDLMRRNADTLAGDLRDSGFDDVELDWSQSDPSADDQNDKQPLWLVAENATLPITTPQSRLHDGALDIQL